MPWKPGDARAKTRRADTPAEKRQWAKTANRVLAKTGDEGRAVRIANAAIKDRGGGKSGRKRS